MPMLTIIIPCRNEEKYIDKCLNSIIANDYPKEKLEILVLDGMSKDKTRDIITQYSKKYSFINLLDNPKKIVPTALNQGIKNSKGSIILRIDAHNIYKKDYISKCVKYLQDYNVDNVGGIWITLPGREGLLGNAIALGLSHPFGIGNAYYRIGSKKPKFVDTVPFGCYRKAIFDKLGLFDEDLVRNQDDEFNLRIIKNGGKILLSPDIISYYYTRDSLLKLWNMYYQYGYFKPLVVKKIGKILTWRQLIPPLFVGSLITLGLLSLTTTYFLVPLFLIFFLYVIINLLFSFSVAFRKNIKSFVVLPIIFLTLHLSYGIGYLKGIFDFIILNKKKKKKTKDMPLTR
jgi:glycosyltransferase involved in cell wall biosynthesis